MLPPGPASSRGFFGSSSATNLKRINSYELTDTDCCVSSVCLLSDNGTAWNSRLKVSGNYLISRF